MHELPEVTGLFETHLTVCDLDRAVAFYRDVVGLRLALELPERGAAFFWIGGEGEAMLGLWSLGSAPMGLSLHIALEDVRSLRCAALGRRHPAVRIESHTGTRDELRALFAEAEDSAHQLDACLDEGEVLVARVGDRVVGHLQL